MQENPKESEKIQQKPTESERIQYEYGRIWKNPTKLRFERMRENMRE